MTPEEQLAALLPKERRTVMDLVAAAGVDVTTWGFRKDGSRVRNPKTNPQYCYEWAFGGDTAPAVLCVWHRSLFVRNGRITHEGNPAAVARRLRAAATEFMATDPARHFRVVEQAKRAEKFAKLVAEAFAEKRAVRLILVRGNRPMTDEAGDRAETVDFRELDPVAWRVESVAQDGAIELTRMDTTYLATAATPSRDVRESTPNANLPAEAADSAVDKSALEESELAQEATAEGDPPSVIEPEPWIDQFVLLDAPERRQSLTSSYERKPEVRQIALRRAQGRCELCGVEGFRTEQGVYLETHHVIPLSEGGPDHPSNVVALCANDHRRAHFSTKRDAIRQQLLTRLAEMASALHGG